MSDPYEVYERLLTYFGPQGWWPGETPLEIALGAILVQNTNWRNVERAIENLREADALELEALHELALEELEELIRPAGYYRQKAARLKRFVDLVMDEFAGSLDELFALPTNELRERLLRLNGIGPETADSILLYAGNHPVFVVDTYTHRVAKRHGWIDFEAGYDELQQHFTGALEHDAALFNEYHALLVELGKRHCKKKLITCAGCPLEDLLPSGGPCEPW